MDDVIPQSGGFLPITIDGFGYMRIAGESTVVHRETRDLHTRYDCHLQFSIAKKHVPNDESAALLELTPEGGGAAVWLPEAHTELLTKRLKHFHSCYGRWPVRTLEI